jgi:hypothetical protein
MKTGKVAVLAVLLFAGRAFGQAEEREKEPAAIIEFGAAGQWALTHGTPSYGPNFAVEVTPIKDWLEIEAGVTPFLSRGQTEWNTDLIFKKPYDLSKTTEFMFGVGPEWAHLIMGGQECRFHSGRSRSGFHVLALAEAKIWLVSGANLWIQLRQWA